MQDFQLCPYCGQPLRFIWVHGHGQCAACGTNVDECCRGESGEAEGIRPAKAKSSASAEEGSKSSKPKPAPRVHEAPDP